jgi:hypothetical protein
MLKVGAERGLVFRGKVIEKKFEVTFGGIQILFAADMSHQQPCQPG